MYYDILYQCKMWNTKHVHTGMAKPCVKEAQKNRTQITSDILVF